MGNGIVMLDLRLNIVTAPKSGGSMIGCTALMALHLHEIMARRSGGSMVCNTLSVHIARGSKHWA